MPLDTNKLNKAFFNYSTKDIDSEFTSTTLSDPSIASKFVRELRRSSAMLIPIENPKQEELRNQLKDKCRKLLATCTDTDVIADFDAHIEDSRLAEFGFREIFKMLRSSDAWKLSPQEQVWGIIARAGKEFEILQEKTLNKLESISNNDLPIDPLHLKIETETGKGVSVDSVVYHAVRNLGDALITLSYVHKWFEPGTGAVIIPEEIEVSENIRFKAGNFDLAAAAWRSIEQSWDRSRLFNARFRIRKEVLQIVQGGSQSANILEISSAEPLELIDIISQRRLLQISISTQRELDSDIPINQRKTASTRLRLPPDDFLSAKEKEAVEIIEGHYHIKVDDRSIILRDLPFNSVLRGYSYLEVIARQSEERPGFSHLQISGEDLRNGLVSVGLSSDEAISFISLATFGRGVADLFDAPLIKLKGDTFIFFAPAYHAPTLSTIILSRISWLNRQRSDDGELVNRDPFEEKGRLFENQVINLFEASGLPVCGFKYKLAGTHYDCDAAALIGETLFIFECKNRSLPMGHIPSICYFMQTLDEAKVQVTRICEQISRNPEIITSRMGIDAKWSKIVPVVLQALPWSLGEIDGVYFYDGSALINFIQKGAVSMVLETATEGVMTRREIKQVLRKGVLPTASELEKEMADPSQVRLNRLGWEQASYPIQLSTDTVFAFSAWSQKEVGMKEQLRALSKTSIDR